MKRRLQLLFWAAFATFIAWDVTSSSPIDRFSEPPLIAATPGFLKLEVRPCVEAAGKYLLLVAWESVEAHSEGFRGSDRYGEWKRRLHHFYEPFPLVEHYRQVASA